MHFLLIILGSVLVPLAHAQGVIDKYCTALGPSSALCATSQAQAESFLANFALGIGNIVLGFMAASCVLAVIYGGIKITTSGGDTGGREEGKKIILFAVLGLLLAAVAEAFVLWVGNFIEAAV